MSFDFSSLFLVGCGALRDCRYLLLAASWTNWVRRLIWDATVPDRPAGSIR
jgi:hypothetical protein